MGEILGFVLKTLQGHELYTFQGSYATYVYVVRLRNPLPGQSTVVLLSVEIIFLKMAVW